MYRQFESRPVAGHQEIFSYTTKKVLLGGVKIIGLIVFVFLTLSSARAEEETTIPITPPQLFDKDSIVKLTGNLPANYWANSMPPGSASLLGKTIRRKPAKDTVETIPLNEAWRSALGHPPNELVTEILGETENAKRDRMSQRMRLADWIVDNEFRSLAAEKRRNLKAIFRNVVEKGLSIEEKYRAKTPNANEIADIQKLYSGLLAKLLIAERNAYRGESSASMIKKFGKTIDYRRAFPNESELADQLLPFFTGKYLDQPKKAIVPKAKLNDSQRFADVAYYAQALQIEKRPNTYTIQYLEGEPEAISIEGRIYVAESSAVQRLDDLLYEENPPHTSIVAGLWILWRHRVIVETYQTPQPPPPGVRETAQATRERLFNRKLLKRVRYSMTTMRFNSWDWANGCSGSYGPGDKLTLVEQIYMGTDAEGMKLLRSYTPTDDGTYCRNRATTYPIGWYGVNWVCHQAANAFMSHRRGYEPVYYWYSYLLFWSKGNYRVPGINMDGVSHCSDVFGKAMHGCVPGSGCKGNVSPPYVPGPGEPFEYLSQGYGSYLMAIWNPKPNKGWLNSEASYTELSISDWIGPDDYPQVESVEDMPIN